MAAWGHGGVASHSTSPSLRSDGCTRAVTSTTGYYLLHSTSLLNTDMTGQAAPPFAVTNGFHRRELTLCASRNAVPETFRTLIAAVEAGRIDTKPWITHRCALADTPHAFPATIAGNPAVLKAMIAAD